MRVTRPTIHTVDIGPLDHAKRLPMSGRISAGMTTKCDACRQDITDTTFIAGFQSGRANMKFHEACCKDDPAVWMMLGEEELREATARRVLSQAGSSLLDKDPEAEARCQSALVSMLEKGKGVQS